MTQEFPDRAARIATENFAKEMGVELIEIKQDHVRVKLPYHERFGVERIHGGVISALIDIAATSAFWSTPLANLKSRGATVSLNINFLKLAKQTDLEAKASVIRRGGTLCTGQVAVTNESQEEVAFAVLTYKLTHT